MGDKNDKSGCSATRMKNAINLGTIQVRPQGECHDIDKCSWILCRIVNEASGAWGIFEEEIGSKVNEEWRGGGQNDIIKLSIMCSCSLVSKHFHFKFWRNKSIGKPCFAGYTDTRSNISWSSKKPKFASLT